MKLTLGMGSAWAAKSKPVNFSYGNDDDREKVRTGTGIKFLGNGVVGLLQFLKERWRDGKEVNTSKSLDLADLNRE